MKSPRISVWTMLGSLLLGSIMLGATPASAHNCQTVGEVNDATGCDAHNCGGTDVHNHYHDVPWYDWHENDHACLANSPTTPNEDRCTVMGSGISQQLILVDCS